MRKEAHAQAGKLARKAKALWDKHDPLPWGHEYTDYINKHLDAMAGTEWSASFYHLEYRLEEATYAKEGLKQLAGDERLKPRARKVLGAMLKYVTEAHAVLLKAYRETKPAGWNKSFKEADADSPAVTRESLRVADFVTFPPGVKGAVCSNCQYRDGTVCGFEGKVNGIQVSLVGQPVSERTCCSAWDREGTAHHGREGTRKGLRSRLKHLLARLKSDWHEEDHPRADDGRFGDKPGAHEGKPAESGDKPGKPAGEGEASKKPARGEESGKEPSGEGKPKDKPDGDGKPKEGKEDREKVEAAERDYKENGTKAKAFKDWFGDWEKEPEKASKVVNQETGEPQESHAVTDEMSIATDGKGKPLVVYHGTSASFDQFERSENVHSKMLGIKMFFFTDNKAVASTYAIGETAKLMPVYLNLRNPLIIEANGRDWTETLSDIQDRLTVYIGPKDKEWKERAAEIFSKYDPDDVEYNFDETVSKEDQKTLQKLADAAQEERLSIRKKLKLTSMDPTPIWQTKEDGIIIRGSLDMTAVQPSDEYTEGGYSPFADIYVALHPEQIKSVDNRGTFDPSSGNINKSAPSHLRRLLMRLRGRLKGDKPT